MGQGIALPAKEDVARGLLLRGSVFVHLDPRAEGVAVPVHLSKQPQLVLQVGLDMVVPIPDLRVDQDGIFGTLSFNRTPFTVMVPWDAVFALADDQGRAMVWPDSLPDELRAEVEREMGIRPPAGLRVVEGVVETDDDEADDLTESGHDDPPEEPEEAVVEEGSKRKLPPYLRVVK